MTTAQGLALSLAVAYTCAAALYMYSRNLYISNWRLYRRFRGGTWRHSDGRLERYERRKDELAMSRQWRQQLKKSTSGDAA